MRSRRAWCVPGRPTLRRSRDIQAVERGRSATLGEVSPASRVLPPLVQVVQLLWISGAEETQCQLANQRRSGAAWTSAARAWLSWAEAAPPLATAAARKGVLLTLRSALRLRLELP